MTPNQQLPNSTKRVRKENEELQKLWDLYHEKLCKLRHALASETDAAKKFQLEQQINEVQTQLRDIENRLDESEVTLQQAGLGHSQNDENQQELPNREIPEIDRDIKQVEAELDRVRQENLDETSSSGQETSTTQTAETNQEIELETENTDRRVSCDTRWNRGAIAVLLALGTVGSITVVFLFITSMRSNPEVCKLPAADVSDIDFSPNGKYLATASLDNTVRVLKVPETNTDQNLTETTTDQKTKLVVDCKLYNGVEPNKDKTIRDGLVAIKFSPNGNYLATAGFNSARLWKVNKNDGSISFFKRIEHKNEKGENAAIVAIDFSQDSNYLATASSTHTIKVWDLETKEKEKEEVTITPYDLKAYIVSVKFSSDGKLTATNINGIVYVWELKTNNSVFEFQQDGKEKPIVDLKDNVSIVGLSFSPREKYIAAISLDKKAYIWESKDQTKGKLLKALNIKNVTAITFSSDDDYLAVADTDAKVTVWKTTMKDSERLGSQGNGLVMAIAFTKDARYLAIANADGNIDIKPNPFKKT